MKIYLLTLEPYHDNSEVHGAYGSRDAAVVAAELLAGNGEWRTDIYPVPWLLCPMGSWHDEVFLHELELQ